MKSIRCQSCGIPTPATQLCQECGQEIEQFKLKPKQHPSATFKLFFIGLVLFCLLIMLSLPR